jgi:hypothetical protein
MGKIIGFVFGLLLISSVAWAGAVTKTISSAPPAAGTWTGAIAPLGQSGNGFLNISVYGATWSGTVTLQRSFDDGVSWYDITTFTANRQKALVDREGGVRYRIGMKNGAYSSGSVAVRLSR